MMISKSRLQVAASAKTHVTCDLKLATGDFMADIQINGAHVKEHPTLKFISSVARAALAKP
jgi:hypothetical protein